jgi:hypothetical protein
MCCGTASVVPERAATTFLLPTSDHHDQGWSGLAKGGFSLYAATVLRAERACAHTARSFTVDLLTQWNVDDDKASAVLIVGELTANAAQHGRSGMAVSLSLYGQTLDIKVADFG